MRGFCRDTLCRTSFGRCPLPKHLPSILIASMSPQHREHLVVQPPVAGDDLDLTSGVEVVRPAGIIADLAARLGDAENPGQRVPGVEAVLPVAVGPPGGDKTQIER